MSIHETMKQITEIAETLVVSGKVQGYVISEGQQNKNELCIIFHDDAPDKTELVLGDDFEIKVENDKTFVVRKQPQYPKTYEECCKILGLEDSIIEGCLGYEYKLLNAFQKLLLCRDAYWKIAGDWKPNFSNDDKNFMIACYYGKIYTTLVTNYNRVLVFPTEEMRDAFYENFKELIEECKELL